MQSQLLKRWGPLAGVCLIGVPIAIYLFGNLFAGPYMGEGGFLEMTAAIYVDAFTLNLSALILLLSPAILVGIWVGVAHLRRRLPG